MALKLILPALAAIAFSTAAPAQDKPDDQAATAPDSAQASSQFVGRYDGSSMETAMRMIVRADGTWAWGVSVGALDMRAEGKWFEEDDTLVLVSDPKPVEPEFSWQGFEKTADDGPLLRIVWSTNGEPFQYGEVRGICANGEVVWGQVSAEGWSPPDECDAMETVELYLDMYQVLSEPFDLKETFNVSEGETIRFQFTPNDLGVANFDGVMGRLKDGSLILQGGQWPLELRKVD